MLLWQKNFPYGSRFINFYAFHIRSTSWKIRDAIYTAHRVDSIDPSFASSAKILEKFLRNGNYSLEYCKKPLFFQKYTDLKNGDW